MLLGVVTSEASSGISRGLEPWLVLPPSSSHTQAGSKWQVGQLKVTPVPSCQCEHHGGLAG